MALSHTTIFGGRGATVVLVTLGMAWVGSEALAEEAAPEDTSARYTGTYKYGKSLDHGRAIVRAAMDKAIDQLNPFIRPLARSKLRSSNPLVREIRIARPDGRIAVTLIGQKRATFDTRPGVPEKVRNPEGKQVELTQQFVKGRLDQIFVGPKGRSVTRYTLLSDDRRLRVDTKMSGKGLKSPISWRLVYVKQ